MRVFLFGQIEYPEEMSMPEALIDVMRVLICFGVAVMISMISAPVQYAALISCGAKARVKNLH